MSGEDTKYKMLMRGNEHPWYENIKITCKECDNQFWLGQFMKHIILNHKMPIKVSGLFMLYSSMYIYFSILFCVTKSINVYLRDQARLDF